MINTVPLFRERSEALRALKAGPCLDCNLSFLPCAMDFDHRDTKTKLGRISHMSKRLPWDQVLEEVAKCDLVCACCHRLRTYKQGNAYLRSMSRRYKYHRAIVDELKSSSPCTDCGLKRKACQMDFDHVEQQKTTHPSWLLTAPTEKLLTELNNCQLVCANCHRVRTFTGVRSKNHPSDIIHQFELIATQVVYPTDGRLTRTWHDLVGTMLDAQVAMLAGVSRSAVSTHRRKKGIPSFRSSGKCISKFGPTRKFDAVLARQLRAKGFTFREIAEQLGVSSASIYRVVNQEAQYAIH